MNSCELPLPGQAVSAAARVSPAGSRIHRFQPATQPDQPHTWQGVPLQAYKPAADHHCGVVRSVLVGDSGENTLFQVRYFEIAPGGNTTLEQHRHEHVVVVLRGRGEVFLDGTWYEVTLGDTVYVAPLEVHQLRNRGEEPFGFLCIVDAQRDVPVPVAVS
jgi:quercetin dioxygenase-like cupin family protein